MASHRSQNEPQLDVDDIQADILVGLQKDQQVFLSFTIVNVPAFKHFLELLTPRITTMRVALEREYILATQKAAGTSEVFSFVGVVVAFTAAGLRTLAIPDVDTIADGAFKAGLGASSPGLNDPIAGVGSPATWVLGGSKDAEEALHGLVMITGPGSDAGGTADPVARQVALVRKLAGRSWTILREEIGATREDARGHEHFGFQDGISQPAVRGRIDESFPAHLFLAPGQNPNDPGQGLPGQDLIWPGAFVFGLPGQSGANPDDPGPVPEGGPAWMKNGSFLVYRRLRQLVPEFDAFVEAEANALDMDPDLLGARLVGRWKSGAPLVVAPLQDDPALGADPLFNNAFEFTQDKSARRCPYAAHIRKSYPRNDITPAATSADPESKQRDDSETATEQHRIMRAGIPYGPPLSEDEKAQRRSIEDRGLMFVCYQTSIVEQFEFILKRWVNNSAFPPASPGPAGEDPILGQAPGARIRHFAGPVPAYPGGPNASTLTLPKDFIIPTGGGYFFVPSLDALATVFV